MRTTDSAVADTSATSRTGRGKRAGSAGAIPGTHRRNVDRLLLRVAGRGGSWGPPLAVAALADAVATMLIPAALSRAVDDVIAARATWSAVLPVAALVALSAAGEVLAELASGGTAARATAWMRRTLLRHVLATGPASGFSPGDLSGRLVSGTAEAGIAPGAVITALIALLPPAGAITALILIDWRIAAALGVAAPVVVIILRTFLRDTTDTAHAYFVDQGRIAGRLAGALAGHRTIAAASTARREEERILAALPDLRSAGDAIWRTQGAIGARGLVTVLFLQIAVLAIAGFELAAGRISTGELIAATQYAGLAAGIGPVIGQLVRLGRARAAVARAAEVLARPVPGYGGQSLPPGPGALEFRHIRAGGVFDDLCLTLPGGRTIAIVGRSGAGKSLLAALAGRLADPDDGQVLLDGVPLPGLSRGELRDAVGYAFARPVLFGATIGEAIAFGPREVTPEQIRTAARRAGADPFVRRLPKGYDTPLADTPMSGGELQRVGLARSFTHPGRLLILDDATSSLDTATELQVSRTILGAFSGRTRLIIARRAATAARADLVVWLEDGAVRGCHLHDVLWLQPDYRAVFEAGAA